MRFYNIDINESYKDAANVFKNTANKDDVAKYIDLHKSLKNRGIIKGDERDIMVFLKNDDPWKSFKTFIDDNKEAVSNKQRKKAKKSDSIVVHKDERFTIVIPLTKEASQYYGNNTKWCTSAREDADNRFYSYTFKNRDMLLYIIDSEKKTKYAARYSTSGIFVTPIVYYDELDNAMSVAEFEELAEPLKNEFIMKLSEEHKESFLTATDINRVSDELKVAVIQAGVDIFDKIENPSFPVIKAAVKQSSSLIDDYEREFTKEEYKELLISNPRIMRYIPKHMLTDDVLRAALDVAPTILAYMERPTQKEIDKYVVLDPTLLLYHGSKFNVSERTIYKATKENPYAAVRALKKHTIASYKALIDSDPTVLKYVKEILPDWVVKSVLRKDPELFYVIQGKMTDEMKKYFIGLNKGNIYYFRNLPSEDAKEWYKEIYGEEPKKG